MSIFIYSHNKSFVNSLNTNLFNYLSPNFFNSLELESLNHTIYKQMLDSNKISQSTSYSQFQSYFNINIYKSLDTIINDYIDIKKTSDRFVQELFKYNLLQYYTNSSNEILQFLSDNNTSSKTFNISRYYIKFKTQYINNKKSEKLYNIQYDTQLNLITNLYELFSVISGLKKMMFSHYNNLTSYDNYSFLEIKKLVIDTFGQSHVNINKYYIMYMYNNRSLQYWDIYNNILKYPSLKDKIVLMFIKYNYIKYNNMIKKIIKNLKYNIIIKSLFSKFIKDMEYEEDDDILNLSQDQYELVYKKLFNEFKSKINKLLKLNNVRDITVLEYTDINDDSVSINLNFISLKYINSIKLDKSDMTITKNIYIHDNDIIEELQESTTNQESPNYNTMNEAQSRLKLLETNADDIQYKNNSINFFKDNFENDKNLEMLIDNISKNNIDFIKLFNLNILKSTNNTNNNLLLNNMIEEIDLEQTEITSQKSFIFDDSHILSPIYEDKFSIVKNSIKYTFNNLLQYIYFNNYIFLYNIYIKHTNNNESLLIGVYKLAYNLLFEGSNINIFNHNKIILSKTLSFNTPLKLQSNFYELYDNIRYFLFKININYKINNNKIPYFNKIITLTNNMNIYYADNTDEYFGLGKYGQGKNMIGKFLEDYRKLNNKQDISFYDIIQMSCNFNKTIYNWSITKLNTILYTIKTCLLVNNTRNIDSSLILNISKIFFNNSVTNILYIPTLPKSFINYIINYFNFNINEDVIIIIWNILNSIIYNLYYFQEHVINNTDKFQTLVNTYDIHNIEDILSYIISSYKYSSIEESITPYIKEQTILLKKINNNDYTNYTQLCLQLLFETENVPSNNSYINLIEDDKYNITINNKTINIVNSKLYLKQK